MKSFELITVKNVIETCAKKFANKNFKLVFSNDQELEFKVTRATILSSLDFKGDLNLPFDDKKIKTVYDNMSAFERIKMVNTARTLNEIFSDKVINNLSSYILLTYDNASNKLILIMPDNDYSRFVLFEINQFTKKVDNFSVIEDLSIYISDKKFAIPISLECSYGDKVISNQTLSDEEILEAREGAISLASSYDSTFTDEEINMIPINNDPENKTKKKRRRRKKNEKE